MAQIGATIEEMHTLQSTFTRESATVQQLTHAISGQVGVTGRGSYASSLGSSDTTETPRRSVGPSG